MKEREENELNRLIYVSKSYYEENKTQSEIAKELDISRPTVSYLLNKARKAGIVKIDVLTYYQTHRGISQELCQQFNLKSCQVITNPDDLYQAAGNRLLEFLPKTRVLGLGWGINISRIIDGIARQTKWQITDKIVCPLIGATIAPLKGYDPNELIKELSQKIFFEAEYLNCPAFPISIQEQNDFLETENYQRIHKLWKKTNTALITFGSFPSVPDHGSALRFGKKLIEEKAEGCLLSYFFNPAGKLIKGSDDFSIQIPLNFLKRVRNVIGFVPQEANVFAILSGLKAGYVNHLVISEELAEELIKTNHLLENNLG